MNKIGVLAACAALAACGSKDEPTPAPRDTADVSLGGTATGDVTGTYEIKLADGIVVMQTIDPDGTYIETTPDGARVGGGTWRTGDGGRMCFDPEGDEAEQCYTGGAPGEDGSFVMQDAHGEPASTVRKVEPSAAPTAPPAG